MRNRFFTIMNRALHIPLFVLLILILHGCNLYGKIDRDSVRVKQGRYDGETVELTFFAELTGVVSPVSAVYWDRNTGRFNSEQATSDGVTLSYEVFSPFGDLDLKTLSDNEGPSKTVALPLPVFSTPENPYEYTLRVTYYVNGRKHDTYRAKFLLKHPD